MLIELAEENGFLVRSPKDPAQRGGTVTLDVPNGYEETQELLRRDFLLDYRPGAGIRIAPHFYTKDEELELVVREIQSILETAPVHRACEWNRLPRQRCHLPRVSEERQP